jgi:hypothetical protein
MTDELRRAVERLCNGVEDVLAGLNDACPGACQKTVAALMERVQAVRDAMLVSQSSLEAELLSLKDQCECIYRVYPRKVGKKAALEAIKVALRSKPYAELMEAVTAYAESPAGKRGKFTPHPATWFRQGRYDDDRSEWQRSEDEPGSSTTFTELPEDL